jgi:hypothetical protein
MKSVLKPDAEGSGCCPLAAIPAAPKSTAEVGRRIYIHEQSLAHLASQSRQAAELVYGTVARVAVLKAIHHQVHQDGVHLGLIKEESAKQVRMAFESEWSGLATNCLQTIGSKPSEPGSNEILPILQPDESVVATCYFSNYYTFATGEEMAVRMYQDESSMAEIRQQKSSGTDYQDLALINGRALTLVNPASADNGKAKRSLALSESSRIRMELRRDLRTSTREILHERLELPAAERSYVQERIDQSLGVVFSRGILKTL